MHCGKRRKINKHTPNEIMQTPPVSAQEIEMPVIICQQERLRP
jgi:hypothetical protein